MIIFLQNVVAVLVAHDISRDEWVAQIPFFPPFQTPEVRNNLLQELRHCLNI